MLRKKKLRKYIFPGAVLIASLYGSVIFAVGVVMGYISTEIFCKKLIETGKIKPMTFDIKNWEIHIHHWLMGGAVILGAYIFGFIGSIPIIFLGILGGLIFHDIHTDNRYRKLHEKDKTWYNVIRRK